MFELITPALLVTGISVSLTGSAVFCLFERIISVVRPALVVCANAPVGFAIGRDASPGSGPSPESHRQYRQAETQQS